MLSSKSFPSFHSQPWMCHCLLGILICPRVADGSRISVTGGFQQSFSGSAHIPGGPAAHEWWERVYEYVRPLPLRCNSTEVCSTPCPHTCPWWEVPRACYTADWTAHLCRLLAHPWSKPPPPSYRVEGNFQVNCVFVLSLFRRVWLFVTLWTIDCQDPLSMEFSRQEYWRGFPFPFPGRLLAFKSSSWFLLLGSLKILS